MTNQTAARIEFGLGTFKQALGLISLIPLAENAALGIFTDDRVSHLFAASILTFTSGYMLWSGNREIVHAESILNQSNPLRHRRKSLRTP